MWTQHSLYHSTPGYHIFGDEDKTKSPNLIDQEESEKNETSLNLSLQGEHLA